MATVKQVLKTSFLYLILIALLVNTSHVACGAESTDYTGTYQLKRFDGTTLPVEIKVDVRTPLEYHIGDRKQYLTLSITADKSDEVSDLFLKIVKCYLGNFEEERADIAWFDFIVLEEHGTKFDMRYEVDPHIEMENARMSIAMSWDITYVNGTTESWGGITIYPDFGPFSINKGTGYYVANVAYYLPLIFGIILIAAILAFIYKARKKKQVKK